MYDGASLVGRDAQRQQQAIRQLVLHLMNNSNKSENVSFPILDSKLITPTLNEIYNVKIIDCGNYVQVYFYENSKMKGINKKDLDDFNLMKINVNDMFENKKNDKSEIKLNTIELKNIIRSKLECQRIAKCNMEDWKSFITLTFKENIKDVDYANKRFRYFIDKVRRIKKDFKYLCITEFQKRGAIHYHVLCNVGIDDDELIYTQEDNKKFKHIKYWIDGFTSVEPLENEPKKVVGYVSKYMTKDIDNRLFSHRRYFYSTNLNKPKSSYINFENKKHIDFYTKKIQDTSLIYQNEYINPYDNSKVTYLEFQK